MSERTQTIRTAVLVAVTIGTAIALLSLRWSNGDNSDDWQPVCVKGQQIYVAKFQSSMMAVNALDADGRPLTCNQ